jgi:hypothetical protein
VVIRKRSFANVDRSTTTILGLKDFPFGGYSN